MRYILNILFILMVLIPKFACAQKAKINDTIAELELTTIARINQGNSYITLPTDIGNIEPLIFEGNIIPNFYIRKSKNSRFMGVLTSQIIIRMYQETSLPVRTPSYMPQVTVYYLMSTKPRVNSLSSFGRYVHHSNGQDGNFYLDNGDINLETGNFSTNYIELGLIKTNYNKRFRAAQFLSTSFEVHPKKLTDSELIGLYSLYRWNTVFSIFRLSDKEVSLKRSYAKMSLKGKMTWMFGTMSYVDNYALDRLNLSLTFFYHPKFLEDIGLFVQLYHGLDYYNIYFNHGLNIIRFGIMTETLRF